MHDENGKLNFQLSYAFASDTGRQRDVNEDAFGFAQKGKKKIFVVADGIGGSNAGEVASAIATNMIARGIIKEEQEINHANIKTIIKRINNRIYEASSERTELDGMGTTIVLLAIEKSSAIIASVGDSRAYLLREGKFKQLTKDHTLIEEMLSSGEIEPQEAADNPIGHMLTRSLGPSSHSVEVDVNDVEGGVKLGDVFVLCSDGLSNFVSEDDITDALNNLDIEKAAHNLVELANKNGGGDNITIEIVKAISTDEEIPEISTSYGDLFLSKDLGINGKGNPVSKTPKAQILPSKKYLSPSQTTTVVALAVSSIAIMGIALPILFSTGEKRKSVTSNDANENPIAQRSHMISGKTTPSHLTSSQENLSHILELKEIVAKRLLEISSKIIVLEAYKENKELKLEGKLEGHMESIKALTKTAKINLKTDKKNYIEARHKMDLLKVVDLTKLQDLNLHNNKKLRELLEIYKKKNQIYFDAVKAWASGPSNVQNEINMSVALQESREAKKELHDAAHSYLSKILKITSKRTIDRALHLEDLNKQKERLNRELNYYKDYKTVDAKTIDYLLKEAKKERQQLITNLEWLRIQVSDKQEEDKRKIAIIRNLGIFSEESIELMATKNQ